MALEAEFWAVLEAAAAHKGESLAALVSRIDDERAARKLPLASALRLKALKHSNEL